MESRPHLHTSAGGRQGALPVLRRAARGGASNVHSPERLCPRRPVFAVHTLALVSQSYRRTAHGSPRGGRERAKQYDFRSYSRIAANESEISSLIHSCASLIR